MNHYMYNYNEHLDKNGIELQIHIDFIPNEDKTSMQPLQFHVQTPSGMISTDYIFVLEVTTLKDLLEDIMEYYMEEVKCQDKENYM